MEPTVFSLGAVIASVIGTALIVIQCFTLWMMTGMKNDIADLRNARQDQANTIEITMLKSRVDKLEGKG